MSDSKELAVLTPEAAKEQALRMIAENPDCIKCFRDEDLDTAPLFLPRTRVIKPTKADFYDPIPKIGIMAKPPLVNQMREKAGVQILSTETSKRGEYVWVAHVYGAKLQSDGSMATQDASYEFNAELRAELDALNQPTKYSSDIAKRKHLLELAKFGEQRAVTGAQHALIHKLASVPRSFKTPQELMRGMIVLRIERNVGGLLRDPEMRPAVIQHALGVGEEIYGPPEKRNVTPAREALPPPEEEAAKEEIEVSGPDFDDVPWEETEEDIARRKLQSLEKGEKPEGLEAEIPVDARDLARTMLARSDATLGEMNELIERIEGWIRRQKQHEEEKRAKGKGGAS